MKGHGFASRWLYIVGAIIFFALAFVFYFCDTITTTSDTLLIDKHKSGIGALTTAPKAEFLFHAEQDDFDGVEVMVSTYNKKLKSGRLTLWLDNDAGQEIARAEYPLEHVKNNSFVTLRTRTHSHDTQGRAFVLHATSDCTEQKGVTLRMGPVAPEKGTKLTLSDGVVDEDNALYMRTLYTSTSYGIMGAVLCLMVSLCFAACIPLTRRAVK